MSGDDTPVLDRDQSKGLTALVDELAQKRHLLVGIYGVVLAAFLVAVGLFGPWLIGDVCYNLVQVLRGGEDEWIWAMGEPEIEYDVFNIGLVVAFVLLQVGFVWGGGRVRVDGKRVGFRRVALSIVIISGLAALLTFAAVVLGAEIVNLGRGLAFEDLSVTLQVVLASWVVWFFIIVLVQGQRDQSETLSRLISVLLAGSWIEFAVALPVELAKRDEDCPCVVGSWIALLIVVPIIIWTIGPALYLLYLREKRLNRENPGRSRRVLVRKTVRPATEEPAL